LFTRPNSRWETLSFQIGNDAEPIGGAKGEATRKGRNGTARIRSVARALIGRQKKKASLGKIVGEPRLEKVEIETLGMNRRMDRNQYLALENSRTRPSGGEKRDEESILAKEPTHLSQLRQLNSRTGGRNSRYQKARLHWFY